MIHLWTHSRALDPWDWDSTPFLGRTASERADAFGPVIELMPLPQRTDLSPNVFAAVEGGVRDYWNDFVEASRL